MNKMLTVPGVDGATTVGAAAGAAGVTGVVGAWEELSLGAAPDEGVAAADWLRELKTGILETLIYNENQNQLYWPKYNT